MEKFILQDIEKTQCIDSKSFIKKRKKYITI